MKRMFVALALGTLAAAGWPAAHGSHRTTKMARGTVTAIAADTVTVKVGEHEMKFAVDGKTTVEATGAGTKAEQAQAAGPPGAEAHRRREGRATGRRSAITTWAVSLTASRIRAVSSAGPGRRRGEDGQTRSAP